MVIGDRLRDIRKQKNFSQGEMEKRTGLLRYYISRVENGHAVPVIGTLEKIARAFEVPMYQLFYDAERPLDPLSSHRVKLVRMNGAPAGRMHVCCTGSGAYWDKWIGVIDAYCSRSRAK